MEWTYGSLLDELLDLLDQFPVSSETYRKARDKNNNVCNKLSGITVDNVLCVTPDDTAPELDIYSLQRDIGS